MNERHRAFVAALAFAALSCSTTLATSAPATTEAELRAQMADERRQIEATHAARERECRAQFVVTACVEASQARRREALAALDARAAALEDNERKQRATDRQARIDAKVAGQAASAAQRAPLALVPHQAAASRARPGLLRTPSPAVEPRRTPAPDPSEVKAREDEASTRFDQRAREAQLRQRAAAARERQRERSGKPPAAALPPVGASSAAGGAPAR